MDVLEVEHLSDDPPLHLPQLPGRKGNPIANHPFQPTYQNLIFLVVLLLIHLVVSLHQFRRNEFQLNFISNIGNGHVEIRHGCFEEGEAILFLSDVENGLGEL